MIILFLFFLISDDENEHNVIEFYNNELTFV